VKRKILLGWLLIQAAVLGQTVDQQIQKDLEKVLELAAAPKEASEEQRKANVEAFKAALVRFADTWSPRAGELQAGRYPLGRALLLLGRPAEAIPHLERFVRDNPASEDVEDATLALAGAHLEVRQHDRAAVLYEEFLASRPSSPQRIVARYYLAIARLDAGRVDEGLDGLKEVAGTASEHSLVADANLKLVQTLAELGRVDEARARLAALLEKHADAPALLALKEQLDWIGRPAPEIEGVRTWLNGAGGTLESLRGEAVVLIFFAEPYDSSHVELEKLRDLAAAFAGKPVRFLGLTTYYRRKLRPEDDEDRLLSEFLGARGVRFPVGVVSDFRMLRKYGVKGVPHTVVIGADGTIRYLKVGAGRSDRRGASALEQAIARVVEKPK
jgi:tetratricopeptide (TPR) repeat protein